MPYTRKSTISTYIYQINNDIMPRFNFVKDLGITFDTKFAFNQHTTNILSTTLKTLEFILRTCFLISFPFSRFFYFILSSCVWNLNMLRLFGHIIIKSISFCLKRLNGRSWNFPVSSSQLCTCIEALMKILCLIYFI